ncbi:hypothetical protein P8C59_006500 [Phyllachora maydis]|uniref:Chromo domain-containing protein n=1 Tax=Phyllachora maydis TaxID=1825666 RepID=A0AAD9I7T5_9PEZI|nr:hypothetical protein P8C59_006500 [Phyllachora maydis]
MGNRLSHAVDGAEVHGPTASKADIGNSTSKPSSDDDKEYPVRALLKWRFTPRTKASPTMPRPVEVLVAWKGYSDKDNTWEPEENLHATCRDMLMFFWHHKQKGRTQALSRRSKRAIKTFPVHKIVDHRLAENPENGPEYLVDWVGYPIKERSWEPGTNLPRLVIDEYMGL